MSRAAAWAACGLLLAAAGCAGWPDLDGGTDGRRTVTVEADGWAPMAEGDSALTSRHRALAEAQKKAVEKAVGVTLRASTRVDDAVNVRQSIEANMGGVIRRYDVLSEGAQGGFFKVRIRADVVYREIPRAGERRAPRFAVRISNPKIAAQVRDAIAASEYELAGAERDADIVVSGVVETYGLADPRLGGMFSSRAKISLRVADARTGKLSEGTYEGSAIDQDEGLAQDLALEKAGRDAGFAVVSLYDAPAQASASLFP